MTRTAAALLTSVTTCAAMPDPCDPVRVAPPSVVPPLGFGGHVAVDGRFWFVSDAGASVFCPGPYGCGEGAVHVYEMVEGELEYRQMLTTPVPQLGEFFGRTVDAEDGRLAIGSINTQWSGLEAKGGAYIYEHDGTRWVLTGTLRPPEGVDPIKINGLGGRVSLEADRAYLAPIDAECVLEYGLQNGEWVFRGINEAPDSPPPRSGFGRRIVSLGEWVFIGASDDSSVTHRGGSVYAYRREPGGPLTFVQKIVPTDAPGGVETTQLFGFDVSFDGQTLAIGATAAGPPELSAGAVLLYELVDGVWTFQEEITHSPSQSWDSFGYTVAVRGDVLLVTAGSQASPTTQSGALHLFRRGVDGEWRFAQQLVPNVPIFARYFAHSIAADSQWVLAGSLDDSDGTSLLPGAAYLFDISCTTCTPDLDADGALTIFDFLAFLNIFQDGDARADFDSDGELTIFDFLAFQNAFDLGCE